MDRQIVFPGSIPLDTDILSIERNTMIALGYLAQATLGGPSLADGLACIPTVPASLTISVGPGSITTSSTIDSTPFGSLPADTTDPLIKMGVNTTPTAFTLTAPTTSGQSINYLIQASLYESDATPVVLPYYNAANPAQPFSGPNNTGTAQNTQRLQRVELQLKPGAPANAGAQATPPIDAGWVGLYVVTVNYGQTQVTSANIVTLPTAPFIQFKLNTLAPGFSRAAIFHASGNFVVPNGVSLLKVRLCGGGAGANNQGGAGGGAGGYAEGIIAVTPGATIPVTVAPGGAGATTTGSAAGAGGTSNFGTALSATGGSGGGSAQTYAYGGAPGSGSGSSLVFPGGYGSDGNGGTLVFAGNGGASAFGGGGRAAAAGNYVQQNGTAPGSGGGGCYGSAGNGGAGANGIVIVEY